MDTLRTLIKVTYVELRFMILRKIDMPSVSKEFTGLQMIDYLTRSNATLN